MTCSDGGLGPWDQRRRRLGPVLLWLMRCDRFQTFHPRREPPTTSPRPHDVGPASTHSPCYRRWTSVVSRGFSTSRHGLVSNRPGHEHVTHATRCWSFLSTQNGRRLRRIYPLKNPSWTGSRTLCLPRLTTIKVSE